MVFSTHFPTFCYIAFFCRFHSREAASTRLQERSLIKRKRGAARGARLSRREPTAQLLVLLLGIVSQKKGPGAAPGHGRSPGR